MIRIFLLLLLLIAPSVYAQDTPEPVKAEDILPYLEQVISFGHAVADTEQMPDNGREVLLKDALKQNAKKILQKSFEFANAQTLMFDADKPAATDTDPNAATNHKSKFLQSVADNNKTIADLHASLASHALTAPARERLNGLLQLATARQELLKTMAGIFNADDKDSTSLADQIKALASTELDPLTEQNANKEPITKTLPVKEDGQTQGNDGMFKLSANLLSLSRKQSQLNNLIEQNKSLTEKNHAIAGSIRAVLKTALETGKALAAQGSDDAKSMTAYRQSLGELITRYKLLTASIIPIGEMNVTLESSLHNLQDWSKLINEDWSHTFRQLLLRLVILGVAIAVPLVGSSIAHRAILRYIKDSKREKQLNIVRRVILIAVLAFVVLANFITEFGSLATFAGFITAGLAVALQTVLVSLVAHFFFFGRFGISKGDRVTISDVTGEVIQVGMLRLYMRELKEQDGKWIPSGKMVAFPNSILFQPAAFYKHVEESE